MSRAVRESYRPMGGPFTAQAPSIESAPQGIARPGTSASAGLYGSAVGKFERAIRLCPLLDRPVRGPMLIAKARM